MDWISEFVQTLRPFGWAIVILAVIWIVLVLAAMSSPVLPDEDNTDDLGGTFAQKGSGAPPRFCPADGGSCDADGASRLGKDWKYCSKCLRRR